MAGFKKATSSTIAGSVEVTQATATSLQCEPVQFDAGELYVTPVQATAGDLNVTAVQATATSLQCEPVQPTAADLQCEPVQPTASDLQMEPVQTDQTELNAQTYEVGPWTRRKFTTSPTNVDITSATATSAELTVGQWQLASTIDTWILQGTSAVTADTSDHFIPAGEIVPFYVSGTSDTYMAGITDAGTGAMYLSLLD
jgi:hypothetical protein